MEIVAEIGVNHNGNVEIAKELIDISKDAGADHVKLQAFNFPELSHLSLSFNEIEKLYIHANDIGMNIFTTAFNRDSIHFLNHSLKQKIWKIPSGFLTNIAYVTAISKVAKRIIVSTGMADIGEIMDALFFLDFFDIIILHCRTIYPAPINQLNLSCIYGLNEIFGYTVGYSDHSGIPEIPAMAVCYGAKMIEAHITLDKRQEGFDHRASLDPKEFEKMVKLVGMAVVAKGDGYKRPSNDELINRNKIRSRDFK
jgi:N,N'-diacetyllegionaminate synthase